MPLSQPLRFVRGDFIARTVQGSVSSPTFIELRVHTLVVYYNSVASRGKVS